jgi:hypothetical protein
MGQQARSRARGTTWAVLALSGIVGFVLAGSDLAAAVGSGRSGVAQVQVVAPPADAPKRPPAAPTAPAAPSERLGVSVIGGPISVTPSAFELTLTLDGGVFRGTLPAITVVDARGTLAGWSVHVATTRAFEKSVRRTFAGSVAIDDVAVTVVDGDAVGLRERNSPKLRAAGAELADARPGHGGGTYRIDGTVEVKAHPHNRATTIVVPVLVTLG